MKKYRIPVAVLSACLLAGALSACGPGENAKETPKAVGSSNYDDLVGFFKEWRAFQLPKFNDGVPDYTPAAMGEQKLGLEKLRARLVAFDTSRWTVSQLVDYHLIRAEMNGLDFDHRVLRPWSRDPAFYVTTPVEFGPRMEGWVAVPRSLPVPPDRLPELKLRLQAVPKILEQAKGNLAEPAADLAALAIHAKDKEIQIYKDLASKLAAHHPDLVGDAENAARACESFRVLARRDEGQDEPAGRRRGRGLQLEPEERPALPLHLGRSPGHQRPGIPKGHGFPQARGKSEPHAAQARAGGDGGRIPAAATKRPRRNS